MKSSFPAATGPEHSPPAAPSPVQLVILGLLCLGIVSLYVWIAHAGTLRASVEKPEDAYYNLIRPHKSLRLPMADALPQKWRPQTPAMAAHLTDHIWTVKELLTTLPLPRAINT